MEKKKQNLLITIPFIPYPPFAGNSQRVWNELVYLSEYFNIYLCIFVHEYEREKLKQDNEALNIYYQHVKKIIFLKRKWNINKRINWIIAKYFSLTPTNLYFDKLRKSESSKLNMFILENNIDILLFCSLFCYYIYKKIKGSAKIVFELHDIQNHGLYNDYKNTTNLKRKLEYYYEYIKWARFEKMKIKEIKNIVVFTKLDKNWIEKFRLRKNIIISPIGFPGKIFKYVTEKYAIMETIRILFVGSHFHIPNKYGGEFIIKKILPGLPKNIHFKIIGEGWDEIVKNSDESARITCSKKVPNLIQEYDDSDIIVLPIFFGSGMNVKLVEALATGRPVITTNFAVQKLKPEALNYILIAEKENEYIYYINKLAQDKDFYRQYSENREEWVYSNYSYEIIMNELAGWLNCVQ
jgi:glycosyltransferase involved in cell wall biosynthesis